MNEKIIFRGQDNEFDIFKVPYDVILTVRLLLMREKRPGDWKMFQLLQHSLEDWLKMDPWEQNQEEKIDIIQNKLELRQFTREDILKVNLLQRKTLSVSNNG